MSEVFSVNLWGSHPDEGNDDCWTGADFATLAEAEAAFADPWSHLPIAERSGSAYIELAQGTRDGTTSMLLVDTLRVRKNPDFRPRRRDDGWRHEQAMQAGMGMGIDAYNDWMGY